MRFDSDTLEFNKVLNKLVSYASTNLAKSEIEELKPENNFSNIGEKLDEVEEALNSIIKYDSLPLGGIYNIKNSVIRSSLGGILNASELLDISSTIAGISNILKYRSYLNSQKISVINLNKYFDGLIYNQKLKNEINTAIDTKGMVVDNASPGLFLVRKNLNSAQNRLRSKMNELLISRASQLTENLIVSRGNRLCLPVKAEFKNTFGGIIHDESSSGTTVYIEPSSCIELSNQIESLINQEKKEVELVLKGLSLLVSSDSENLLSNLTILTNLDIIYAKALYAKAYDMTKPEINENGYVNLIKARHPLIDKETVVPTDIYFGKEFNIIIITGPNTGGKTVVLKTVGLLTLMMQSGMFIPAAIGSKLAVFDNVFVDIGDEQSIEQSLSTFSSHMTKICNIVNQINYNSLVLLDELGSGTDPKEGASLAISIIEYMKERGTRVITTTHYSDLKAYAYSKNDICNASVEFNSETLQPTYKLLMGVPGKSNAILIAQRLGLNEKILANARELMDNRVTDSQELMEKLDVENAKISSIKNEYEHMISEYNSRISELEKEKNNLTQNREKFIESAKKEADEIIEKAKLDSLELIEKIEKMKANQNFKEHELADIKYTVRNLTKKEIESKLFDENLQIGDFVHIGSYNKDGIIINIKKDKYDVQVGQFTMTFKKSDLTKTKAPAKRKETKSRMQNKVTSNAKLELDLRGFRYEEVASEIDSFIDQAYLANMSMISIIHGFGTGAVRDAVQSYLKRSPYVKSYRYGGEGEGLNGVTVVYLK